MSGKNFGDVGPYERIAGTIYFSLPVDNVHNAAIVDLKNAVNLHNGEVEFSADLSPFVPRIRNEPMGRSCWKFPIVGAAGLLRWSTEATGM